MATKGQCGEPADEGDAFRRYIATGDRSLRNELVCRHQHLVELHVRRYAAAGYGRDDVRQVALLALIGAVERFDPDREVRFATFADRTIQGELKRFARDQGWAVRPPRSLQDAYLEVVATDAALTQRLRRSPTVTEVARELRRREDDVIEALDAGRGRRSLSIHRPLGSDPDQLLVDQLGDADPALARVEVTATVERLLTRLGELERRIVELTVLHQISQDQVATALGVSQSCVSRTRARALSHLRSALEAGSRAAEADGRRQRADVATAAATPTGMAAAG